MHPIKPSIRRRPLALLAVSVPAGFPSPADDYVEKRLDLNDLLISHPASTFFMRASGESMTGAGIRPGDVLVVDSSLHAKSGDVVIAVLEGEFTVKRYLLREGRPVLVPENPEYEEISIPEEGFEVWGVVTGVIHKFR